MCLSYTKVNEPGFGLTWKENTNDSNVLHGAGLASAANCF